MVPENYAGKMCGLCGDYDGEADDVTNTAEWGDMWRVPDADGQIDDER